MKKLFLIIGFGLISITSFSQSPEGYKIIENDKGPYLGYSPTSGIKILTVNELKFKDLNKNGKLDKYEDWRLPIDERAKDLAKRLSVEEIARLILYSGHQTLPSAESGFGAGTYNGKTFSESGAHAWNLSDAQKIFLKNDNLRHVLIVGVESPEVAA